MCVVSMVGDHYADKYRRAPWKDFFPVDSPDVPSRPISFKPGGVTREEFDALKRDVEEMKALLQRAKRYDDENHEPDCEVEEKMVLLRKIAELVGVDLDDVIGKSA